MVRDLASACGKQVRLVLEGTDTELDKAILEAIRDPLTHLVRNAVDHGIETPEVRKACGKDPEGTLTLRASHEGGLVILEIEDDGGGIPIERIKKKAVLKDLVPPDRIAHLTDREWIQFIFAPSNLPTPARLLRPQLRYHLAGDIPTYTLGDAYEPHPTANEEIEGMMFPDMPWMVGDTSLTAEVRNVAAQAFGDSGPRRGRLFAYGFDAMRLASSLQRGAPIGPDGLTGTLSMDAQGRIRRSLNWVRIKSGAPVPMDATPAITAQ